jgi:hypothetical protein
MAFPQGGGVDVRRRKSVNKSGLPDIGHKWLKHAVKKKSIHLFNLYTNWVDGTYNNKQFSQAI